MAKTTIVLADDHPIVRQGFIRIIERDDTFAVVAEADNGDEALALIQAYQPDIAVLDIAMPKRNGLEVAKAMRAQQLTCVPIMLTMYRDREYFDEAMALGIKGYLLKDSAVADLPACLHAVVRGECYISPALSGYLIQGTAGPKPLAQLTPSETAVLKLIAQKKTSKEIADALCISYRTVQNHRTNMCRKLELTGHNSLLHFALDHRAEL
ncbi:response regulator [Acanthopleuribacter pedis]|uniref:Response regulator transcription factor n=1 Tax=Acanthopleuribacter pedis TaxID=442870 RepID=A0A8J7U2T2_9BACT|nr:response regulator transcription factor [Acanthopleuribacter pedis]MBO1318059.1 response regulator transcription factor [Acanthopleuribacter pedis]